MCSQFLYIVFMVFAGWLAGCGHYALLFVFWTNRCFAPNMHILYVQYIVYIYIYSMIW